MQFLADHGIWQHCDLKTASIRFDKCSGRSVADEPLIKMGQGLPEIKHREIENNVASNFIKAFFDMETARARFDSLIVVFYALST